MQKVFEDICSVLIKKQQKMKSQIQNYFNSSKNVITALVLVFSLLSFGQTKNLKGAINVDDIEVVVQNISIDVTVDSIEELESTFNKKDIETIFNETESIDEIVFKLTCNGKNTSSGVNSSVSYQVKGSSFEKDAFFKHIEKIKNAAIKYFNTKN